MIIARPFYFLRHGETDWNAQRRLMGQQDIPLNETGRCQAQKVRSVIEKCAISYVCYSPLKRAAETMALATETVVCSKVPSANLKEWHFGAWEGLNKGGLSLYDLTPPGGESWQQFAERVVAGVNQALMHEGPVLIIAHSGVYAVLCYYMGIENIAVSHCQLLYFNPTVTDTGTHWTVQIIE